MRQLVQAHAYWRSERTGGRPGNLERRSRRIPAAPPRSDYGTYCRRHRSQRDRSARRYFRKTRGPDAGRRPYSDPDSVAHVIITDSKGSLADQINGAALCKWRCPALSRPEPTAPEPRRYAPLPRQDLTVLQRTGRIHPGWARVCYYHRAGANDTGALGECAGQPELRHCHLRERHGYTWSENAHEFRLTPWDNDPVSDSRGEAFYLRDEESGHFWSPTPLPCRGVTPYVTRHGFGYSVFEHTESGIHSELWVYMAMDAPIKFMVLKVRNQSDQYRRLSATGYVEWVLGDLPPKSAMHVITEIDPKAALFSRATRTTPSSATGLHSSMWTKRLAP